MPDETRTYDILQVLGEGGQAQVRLLREQRTGKVFAGKFLREFWDPVARDRFREEASRQMRVAGVGVVPIVDFNLDREQPFLVLEYMPKGSLAEELRRRRQFSLVDALLAAREIAGALIQLHAKGVVHRDVKPGNVLRGSNGTLLLSDLGLGATMSPSKHVNAAGFAGTPAYAAPEQHKGIAVPTSDIFALGVTLHELVTGSTSLLNTRAPRKIQELVARMIQLDYSSRPCAVHTYWALHAALEEAKVAAAKANRLIGQTVAVGAVIGLALWGAAQSA